MYNVKYLVVIALMFSISTNVSALNTEAEEGKTIYATCFGCHNPELIPPLGPPMFGIQRRYKRAYGNRKLFIESMMSYVKEPSEDKVVMKEAFGQLGLMPPLPLPDDMLRKVATYIFDESYDPPCTHWEHAIDRAKETGDLEHMQKDQRQLDRFCM